MIVGQQTYEWGFASDGRRDPGPDPVRTIMNSYEEFALGSSYITSPFWRAARVIAERCNAVVPANEALLWSNLIKADHRNARPTPDIETQLSTLGLLQAELRIINPDAVVFFTGPTYDDRITADFPGIEFDGGREFAKLKHPLLPRASVRTYHPNYLQQSGRWNLVERICDDIMGISA